MVDEAKGTKATLKLLHVTHLNGLSKIWFRNGSGSICIKLPEHIHEFDVVLIEVFVQLIDRLWPWLRLNIAT